METITKHKCIFKKKRTANKQSSLKIVTVFLIGVMFGFALSHAENFADKYLGEINIQLAQNSQ